MKMKRIMTILIAVALLAWAGGATFAGPPSITLTGTVRDFLDTHPDMESTIATDPGIVLGTLGADGKPVYAGQAGSPTTHGQTAFDQWYNNTAGVNLAASLPLTLNETSPGSGVYQYASSAFFPIDGALLGNQGRPHNYHFTLEIHTQFTYQGGEVFHFTGNDDLFLFIDDQLVIDLGGVHVAQSGSVSLGTLGLTVGNNYDLDLFFAERHTTQSNFMMQTSIVFDDPVIPSVTIRGRVIDVAANTPIPGVSVTASDQQTLTNANGDYVIDQLPTGSITVTASKPPQYPPVSVEVSAEEPGEYVVDLELVPLPPADLSVTSEDIAFDPLPAVPGQTSTISATIWNEGEQPAQNVVVTFEDDDTELASVAIPSIAAGQYETVSIDHSWATESFRLITVTVDPADTIEEGNEANNSCSKLYQIGDISQMEASLDISCSAPSTVYECASVVIEGEALYNILVSGQTSYTYPAKGSSVSAYVVHTAGAEFLPPLYTDTDGHFTLSFAPPVAAGGVFELVVDVTDGTLAGTWSRSFDVDECKDVSASGVTFSEDNPSLGDTIGIAATIHADPGNTNPVTNVPVVFYGYHSQLGKFQIGVNQTIPEMLPGTSETVSVSWTNEAEGEYYIEVVIGPGFSDNNNANNSAGRYLWVGPIPPPPPPAMFTVTATPYYAITGDIVQITVDSAEPLPSDSLDSITVTDRAGTSLPLLSGVPDHPSTTRWVYRTQALSDSVARGQATITVTGTDGEANTHTGTGYLQVIEPQEPVVRDLWVHSDDIAFGTERPEVGEAITIESAIHADSENTHPTSNIPVSFFAHHGSGSVYQIGRTIWIDQLPLGALEWLVSTTWRNAAVGDYIIEVQLGPGFSDDDNSNNEATRAIIVGNRPPVADPGGPYTGNEGSPVTFNGTGSADPDGDPLTYHWDFGDGTTGTSSTPTHTYADNGTYVVCLTVSDGELSDTLCTAANIANVAPTVGPMDGPTEPVPVGTEVSVSAAFSDPGPVDTHVSSCDWGDGSLEEPRAVTSPVTDSHLYTTAGIYTVQMTVTDDDGGAGQSLFQYVVVYDPSGGFATGNGWIDSPEGAYVPDPLLTGKAIFGFVSRYQKGADVPTGQAHFRFQVAHLSFQSSSYDWLVVTGNNYARFKGAGTINRAMAPDGDYYRFMLWAGDGEPDTFRIKIWWEDAEEVENVVYDNGFDQEIGRGAIVVHAN